MSQSNCFDFEKAWNNYTNLPPHAFTDSAGKIDADKLETYFTKLSNSLIGCKVPDFTVKTIDGKAIFMADLKGKVVVLNFWFNTCEPCLVEIPALNQLVKDYENTDVVFIAFAKDDTPSVKKFLENKEFDYTIVSGDYNMEQKFCLLFGYPENMVIDRKGIVRQILYGGPLDEEKARIHVQDSIQPMINKCLREY